LGRSHRLEREVALAKPARRFRYGDRTNRREPPACAMRDSWYGDGRVFGVPAAGGDRSDNDLTRVHTDAALQRVTARRRPAASSMRATGPASEGGVERALRMILVGDGRAEQREDTIASRLHDVAVVSMNGVDHQLERRIDDRARFSGSRSRSSSVDPLMSANSAGDRLALALERSIARVHNSNGRRCVLGWARARRSGSQRGRRNRRRILILAYSRSRISGIEAVSPLPHCEQNFLPAAFSVPQFVQRIAVPVESAAGQNTLRATRRIACARPRMPAR